MGRASNPARADSMAFDRTESSSGETVARDTVLGVVGGDSVGEVGGACWRATSFPPIAMTIAATGPAARHCRGRGRRIVERTEQRHIVIIDKAVVVKVPERPGRLGDTRSIVGTQNRHVVVVHHAVQVGVARARVGDQDRCIVHRHAAEIGIGAEGQERILGIADRSRFGFSEIRIGLRCCLQSLCLSRLLPALILRAR